MIARTKTDASACGGIAQTAPRLTLQDAETLALKNHPEIRAAENEVAYTNQRIVIDRAAYYPFVTGEGRLAGSGRSTRCGSINDHHPGGFGGLIKRGP